MGGKLNMISSFISWKLRKERKKEGDYKTGEEDKK